MVFKRNVTSKDRAAARSFYVLIIMIFLFLKHNNLKLSYMIILSFCFPRSGGGLLIEEP